MGHAKIRWKVLGVLLGYVAIQSVRSTEKCKCTLRTSSGIHVYCLHLPVPCETLLEYEMNKRFVRACENGKWRTHDLLSLPMNVDGHLLAHDMELEKLQLPLLRRQVREYRVAWMICSKRLGVCKDVAEIVCGMIGDPPYPPLQCVQPGKACMLFIGCEILFGWMLDNLKNWFVLFGMFVAIYS